MLSSALQYRTTVAKMLRRQADESRNAAQFIVTTFHPQVRRACVHVRLYGLHVVRPAHAVPPHLWGQQSDSRVPTRSDSFFAVHSLLSKSRIILPNTAHARSSPQIVGEADQLYGVAHTNRVSRVYTIQREDALTFLQVSLARGGS